MKYLCVNKCWHQRPGQQKKLYKRGEIIDVLGNEALPRHFVKAVGDLNEALLQAEVEERQKIVKIRTERKEAKKAAQAKEETS